MKIYSYDSVKADIETLLRESGLTWDEFLELGRDDRLVDIDENLDFAYRAFARHLSFHARRQGTDTRMPYGDAGPKAP